MTGNTLPHWLERNFIRTLCGTGVWLGTLFFAGSLTPSLIPRDAGLQGALSGISFMLGYGVGVSLRAAWRFLGFPDLAQGRTGGYLKLLAAAVCIGTAALFLWRASEWQNSVRLLMGMAPVESGRPAFVATIALAAALLLLLLGRLFKLIARRVARLVGRIAPQRVAALIGIAFAAATFWAIGTNIVMEAGIRALDASYSSLDALVDDRLRAPAEPFKTGSTASYIRWSQLGRQGRAAVSAAPSRAEIEALTGGDALDPLRIYVGLNSAETIADRVELAFREMLRVGAFERSVLVVTTPTGTGWLDPASQMPLEYLHRGNVATVAIQYSYLASWLTLIVEPNYGAETAEQLFRRVYDHWRTLPQDTRPRLYLHGLSLGALNSDRSVDLFDVIGDPFQGALWTGPPFPSRTWRQATAQRHPESPAWLARFRDGSVVRFFGGHNSLDDADAPWEPLRIVFLQYPSDPITFFESGSAFRSPTWLRTPRGPDVSPQLRWYPLITFLQLGLDMILATTTPMGHGHVYAPEHYVDAWIAVTQPESWTPDRTAQLKEKLQRHFEQN
ncbi:alpha/beta hydrolase [Roseomonas sp. WA12]